MRELPLEIDADAVIAVGQYLDDHAKTTAVSISDALRVIRRRTSTVQVGDLWLEELIIEGAAFTRLAVLLDSHDD